MFSEKYAFHKKLLLRTPTKAFKKSFTKHELISFFSQKEIQEALFLSSPVLLEEFNKWKKNNSIDKGREDRLINSLLKYAMRMHSRCTPFGLFAGCNVVEFVLEKEILINTTCSERNTRLDMNFTCALSQELSKLSNIQIHLKFFPNNSIYILHDKIRYVEYYYKNKKRIHQISSVDNSIYLQKVLKKAENGATILELAQIIKEYGVTLENSLNFIKEIITAQLLVSELEPSLTGKDLLKQTIQVLESIERKHPVNELNSIIVILQNTQNQLQQIDNKTSNDITHYTNIAKALKQLNVPFELGKLFQTDFFISPKEIYNKDNIIDIQKNESAFKKTSLKNGLEDALLILNKLSEKPIKTNLTEFQKKFIERYQYKEVKVSEALDIETGIGYSQNNNFNGGLNPLIDNLIMPHNKDQQKDLFWNKKQSFLLNALVEAQQNKQYTISIHKEDIKEFKENWNDLPDSFSILFKHLGKRNDEDLICIDHIGGSSATCMLGRFALSNKKIEELVTEISDSENKLNPDAILAEISHLPESRTGNVLMRPVFRNFEIPYLSKSSVPKTQQITLDDLYISIKNNQLYLRSKRLNKQVLPRLGNAHNYSFNSLPVYHFLCDIQTQDIRKNLSFNWGNLKSEFTFLPRVETGNVILSPATWQLERKQFKTLFEKKETIISNWQKEMQLPDLFWFVEGDNELLINLNDELSLNMFFSIIKDKSTIILKEFLFDEKTAIIKDKKNNTYTNEFIATVQKQLTKKPVSKNINVELNQFCSKQEKITRSFCLGTEWLYYKLYCGVKTADKILTSILKPLTDQLIKQKLIDNWFFIRYSDPELHLRLRFHLTDLNNIGRVIELFQHSIAEYVENELIWKVQTDTYQREIARYGENTIVLSENIFHYDSKYIVDVLDLIDRDEGDKTRWLFAIISVDELLSNFEYTLEKKIILLEKLKTSFAYEFNMNKNLKIQLDKKFRENRKTITEFIFNKKKSNNEFQPLFQLLKQKSVDIEPLVKNILAIHKNNELQLILDDLLASYIHMLLNRLFRNKQRIHEMVIYDSMWRTYRSELAKLNQSKKIL